MIDLTWNRSGMYVDRSGNVSTLNKLPSPHPKGGGIVGVKIKNGLGNFMNCRENEKVGSINSTVVQSYSQINYGKLYSATSTI